MLTLDWQTGLSLQDWVEGDRAEAKSSLGGRSRGGSFDNRSSGGGSSGGSLSRSRSNGSASNDRSRRSDLKTALQNLGAISVEDLLILEVTIAPEGQT